MKRFAFLLLFAMLFSLQTVFAVVSTPNPINTQQSDNTILTIRLLGDEKLSWAKTLDGYTLLRNDNQDYVYAISDKRNGIIPSNVIAHNEGERSKEELDFLSSISKHLFFSHEQLTLVRQYNEARYNFEKKIKEKNTSTSLVKDYKMLVILMSFADKPFTTPRVEVEALYNQVGYSTNGNGGSVHDYFWASSDKQLNVTATVLGPYTANNNLNYYGRDTVYEWQGQQYPVKDVNVKELITEAIENADYERVDFTPFTNGTSDYEVECVYVLYAGYAQSAGNASNTIWPHRSTLYNRMYAGGVSFYNYGCSSEFEGNENYSAGPLMIGTICHEFSHVLGLPDLYDTQSDNHDGESFHPSTWDIMASGNYNGNSGYPPLWSATEREISGYTSTNIIEIDQEGTFTLPPLDEENKAYKIVNSTNEYFILENRQKRGFDTNLPGHGMLIYHIDRSVWNLNSNCVNCTPGQEGYRVVSATNVIDASNPFPGTDNKTSFTDNTTPNSLAYTGATTNKPIYNIAENNTTKNVTFTFMNSSDYPLIANTEADFRGDTLDFSAQITSLSNLVSISGVCYSTDNNTPTIDDDTILTSNTSTTILSNITGLLPNTYYYLRAFVVTSANKVSYGEVVRIKTPCEIINIFPYEITFENMSIENSCLSVSDEYVTNTWQIVTQATDANNNTINAYSGDNFAYYHTNYISQTPELKLITMPLNINYLSSPALSFAYQTKQIGARKDVLKVYYRTSLANDWTLLKTYNNGTTTWVLDTIDLPTKSTTLYVAFGGEVRSAGGVYVDNVTIFDKNISAYPSITTSSVVEIADISAKAEGNMSNIGTIDFVRKGFVVSSENAEPTILNADIYSSQVSDLGVYSLKIDNLTPNTTYYIRAFAQNMALISYGEVLTFTTICPAVKYFPYQPLLSSEDTLCFNNEGGWQTNLIDSSYTYLAQNNSLEISKLITPMFDFYLKENVSLTFDYKLNSGSSFDLKVLYKQCVDCQWQTLSTINITSNAYQNNTVQLPQTFYNLGVDSLSTHSFFAFEPASNTGAISIRNIKIDATSQIPIISTDSATLADYNKIKVYATLHDTGLSSITQKGICYSTTNNPSLDNNASVVLSNEAGNSAFDVEIDNLPILTQYYVRAFATNSYGTAYGEVIPIKTKYYAIYNNIISEDQELCNIYPAILNGQTPTGGDNTSYSYMWIHSTDLVSWEDCNEGVYSDRATYQPRPTNMVGTHYYARVVTSGLSVDTSNYVTIRIYPESNGGNIFANSSSVNVSDTVVLSLRAYSGDVLSWQIKRPSVFYIDWEEIENSQNLSTLNYTPQAEGEYTFRAVVKSGVCDQAESSERVIQVNSVALIDVNKEAQNLYITPNPSTGKINLVTTNTQTQNILLTINNTNGATVYSTNI
ncbi:MAG: M6 family metalloprotease domain-containing protein, partial [Bacteroidota bacterium]|nr:M6 family metalloprotease domain-containing protein [Bacteroidota bacterium]